MGMHLNDLDIVFGNIDVEGGKELENGIIKLQF